MAAKDWVSNLFQPEHTRGLSGGDDVGIALDEVNSFYNFRLRRHVVVGDLVDDVDRIWGDDTQNVGLSGHLASTYGQGVLGCTDVLIVLSRDDFARALEAGSAWVPWLSRTLLANFAKLSARVGMSLPYPSRKMGMRVICDGSVDMGGELFGLTSGEFITGLMANTYTGPTRGSESVIGVHMNLPGVWEGYQEVGRLYSDQLLFTLGSSWLDNFTHPALCEAAIYRLQQKPDGSFVHMINPDLQERYQVSSDDQGGASVLTLATRDGEPLAYFVLAVVEPEEKEETFGFADDEGFIAAPMLIDDELLSLPVQDIHGSKTIIPDAPADRFFTLQERGVLLQKVHFGAFMLGYDVHLGTRGELGTHLNDPAATFQVRKDQVYLLAHRPNISVYGSTLTPGRPMEISGNVTIGIGDEVLEYRDLRSEEVDGWPYYGEIRRPASSTYMIWGADYLVGRSRECRVVLPDQPMNENIAWRPKVGNGAMIKAKRGDIPKARFYTDSIMVASEHACFRVVDEVPEVLSRAGHCYTYVRREEVIYPLYPIKSDKGPKRMALKPNDEVLIGNSLFMVCYSCDEDTDIAPSPAPAIHSMLPELEREADSLAEAVAEPDFSDDVIEQDTASGFALSDLMDLPPASGLGEAGAAVKPIEIDNPSPMSMSGEWDDFSDLGETETMLKPGATSADDWDMDGWDELDSPSSAVESTTAPDAEWEGIGWDEPADQTNAAVSFESSSSDPSAAPAVFQDSDFDVPDESLASPEESVSFGLSDALSGESISSGGSDASPDESVSSSVSDAPSGESVDTGKEIVSFESGHTVDAFDAFESLDLPSPIGQSPLDAPEEVADTVSKALPMSPKVVFVDEENAQFELARPIQLVQVGWMVNGEVLCANHEGAQVCLPESRLNADQRFEAQDYFHLKVRGKRGKLTSLTSTELYVDDSAARVDQVFDKPETCSLEVLRCDEDGEEDFRVGLSIVVDKSLPDPRARLVKLDLDEPLTAALMTRGFALKTPRTLTLNGLEFTAEFDGERVEIRDYLTSYKTPDGFIPFFVKAASDARFRTVPEDGRAFYVQPGDRLIVHSGVFVVSNA